MAAFPRLSGLAGIVAPILFTLITLAQEILQPDYSRTSMPISALAAWPLGWVQCANFFLYGGLVLVLAAGLSRGAAPLRAGALSVALLAMVGVGAILAGVFPWVNVRGVPTETPMHVVGAILHFASAAFFAMAVSRRMAADPRWRDLAPYALATGAAMFSLFVVLAFFAVDPGTPFHAWAGVIQRVTVGIWFVFLAALGARLWNVGGETATA